MKLGKLIQHKKDYVNLVMTEEERKKHEFDARVQIELLQANPLIAHVDYATWDEVEQMYAAEVEATKNFNGEEWQAKFNGTLPF